MRTLSPGDRVAVIGGGPAGSFAALHLLRFASRLAIPLSVTVFERKDFHQRGPAGCNKCAGVLSDRARRGLAKLGLQIPEEIVQARLEGYILRVDGRAIEVIRPDPGPPILSVYRGGGPLRGRPPPGISFDGWLLSQAQMAGATVVAANVQRISVPSPGITVSASCCLRHGMAPKTDCTNCGTAVGGASC